MVEAMTQYTATATKDGRWWVVQCIEFPGAITQVSRLSQAGEFIREAIAYVADVPESEVEVQVTPQMPEEVSAHVTELARLRHQAQEATEAASALHRTIAHELKTAGLTVRDIGAVLDVSYQRAHQLLST